MRRRRSARDDEADPARLAAAGGDREHAPAVAVGAGAGRDAHETTVGHGAQPVDGLVPLDVEGQAGGLGRVGGPHVAVGRHRDLERLALRDLDRLVGAAQDRPGPPDLDRDADHRGAPGRRPGRPRRPRHPGRRTPRAAWTVSALRPVAPTPTPSAGEARTRSGATSETVPPAGSTT